MARREFEQIVASGTKKGFRYLDLSGTISASANGGTHDIFVYGTEGTMASLMGMYLYCYKQSTGTGSHSFKITELNDIGGAGGFIEAVYPITEDLRYQKFDWMYRETGKTFIPSDISAQVQAFLNAQFDTTTALWFQYTNWSDVDIVNENFQLRLKYLLEDTPKI